MINSNIQSNYNEIFSLAWAKAVKRAGDYMEGTRPPAKKTQANYFDRRWNPKYLYTGVRYPSDYIAVCMRDVWAEWLTEVEEAEALAKLINENMSMQQKLENLGLSVWGEEFGKPRMYVNTDEQLKLIFGLSIGRYGTGNISSARLNGEHISNTHARELSDNKIYFDCVTQTMVGIDLEPII